MASRPGFRGSFAEAAAVIAMIWALAAGSAFAFNQSPEIPLFGTDLRGIGVNQIPVAAPDGPAPVTQVTHYKINITQFKDQIVPTSTGLGKTTLWGYSTVNPLFSGAQKHLGGIIVGKKGTPIQITFTNHLPQEHVFPVDTTIMGANLGAKSNRAVTHLHGGHVPWISDGGPFGWFSSDGLKGESFLNNVLNPGAASNQAEFYYPMDQSARLMWYHDHAIGITRLNAYAGIATALIIRDDFEAGLVGKGLPNYIELGGNEIPLVVQDKIFVGPDINTQDPTWATVAPSKSQSPGSLWYAHVYETDRWDESAPPITSPPPDPSAIPEFFGDTMLVNGTTFPQTTVQARRYRLRILNACNARFLNLQLYLDDGSANGITLNGKGQPVNKAFQNAATGDPSFLVIGNEGGFLANPAVVSSAQPMAFLKGAIDPITGQTDPKKVKASLLMAPAERADLIVDFSTVKPGTGVILYTDAPAPFPSGDDRNDYFPGFNTANNPVNGATTAGYGPNTRVLMRFNVIAATGPADLPLKISSGTNLTAGNDPLLVKAGSAMVPAGATTRFLTLNEYFDEHGRLIQILGDKDAPGGSPYTDTATYILGPSLTITVPATRQDVKNGDTEVWEIYNTTGDVHPMHFHLVNVQLINRQLFDMGLFPGTIKFTGPTNGPNDDEIGWKETVKMYPGTVTRVIMKFDVPKIRDSAGNPVTTGNTSTDIINGNAPPSPRTGGNEYVWHCHILEHEEHDMMHTLNVNP